MKWYEVKEQAAGTKRLIFMWLLYNTLGKNAVKFVTSIVTFLAFCSASNIRKYSVEFLKAAGISPNLINQYRHFLSYSYSLIDKMEASANKFDINNLYFADETKKEEFFNDIFKGKGVFLLCSHLGNIEVLRSLLNLNDKIKINIFMSEEQCKTFNSFIKTISVETNITTFPVEQIGIETSIEIQERLNNGEIVFLAGDRIPQKGSATFEETFLNRRVEFPKGAFKFAKLMSSPVYFIAALKENEKYAIYVEKSSKDEKEMRKAYVKFLESLTLKYPLQFYHFYDFFTDRK